ncbi:unnamed protein product, partial [Amoebophrya sp. A120]
GASRGQGGNLAGGGGLGDEESDTEDGRNANQHISQSGANDSSQQQDWTSIFLQGFGEESDLLVQCAVLGTAFFSFAFLLTCCLCCCCCPCRAQQVTSTDLDSCRTGRSAETSSSCGDVTEPDDTEGPGTSPGDTSSGPDRGHGKNYRGFFDQMPNDNKDLPRNNEMPPGRAGAARRVSGPDLEWSSKEPLHLEGLENNNNNKVASGTKTMKRPKLLQMGPRRGRSMINSSNNSNRSLQELLKGDQDHGTRNYSTSTRRTKTRISKPSQERAPPRKTNTRNYIKDSTTNSSNSTPAAGARRTSSNGKINLNNKNSSSSTKKNTNPKFILNKRPPKKRNNDNKSTSRYITFETQFNHLLRETTEENTHQINNPNCSTTTGGASSGRHKINCSVDVDTSCNQSVALLPTTTPLTTTAEAADHSGVGGRQMDERDGTEDPGGKIGGQQLKSRRTSNQMKNRDEQQSSSAAHLFNKKSSSLVSTSSNYVYAAQEESLQMEKELYARTSTGRSKKHNQNKGRSTEVVVNSIFTSSGGVPLRRRKSRTVAPPTPPSFSTEFREDYYTESRAWSSGVQSERTLIMRSKPLLRHKEQALNSSNVVTEEVEDHDDNAQELQELPDGCSPFERKMLEKKLAFQENTIVPASTSIPKIEDNWSSLRSISNSSKVPSLRRATTSPDEEIFSSTSPSFFYDNLPKSSSFDNPRISFTYDNPRKSSEAWREAKKAEMKFDSHALRCRPDPCLADVFHPSKIVTGVDNSDSVFVRASSKASGGCRSAPSPVARTAPINNRRTTSSEDKNSTSQVMARSQQWPRELHLIGENHGAGQQDINLMPKSSTNKNCSVTSNKNYITTGRPHLRHSTTTGGEHLVQLQVTDVELERQKEVDHLPAFAWQGAGVELEPNHTAGRSLQPSEVSIFEKKSSRSLVDVAAGNSITTGGVQVSQGTTRSSTFCAPVDYTKPSVAPAPGVKNMNNEVDEHFTSLRVEENKQRQEPKTSVDKGDVPDQQDGVKEQDENVIDKTRRNNIPLLDNGSSRSVRGRVSKDAAVSCRSSIEANKHHVAEVTRRPCAGEEGDFMSTADGGCGSLPLPVPHFGLIEDDDELLHSVSQDLHAAAMMNPRPAGPPQLLPTRNNTKTERSIKKTSEL